MSNYTPKPRIQKTAFRCQACDTPFFGAMEVDVEISISMASMLANRCPACKSDKLYLGLNLNLSEDRSRRLQLTSVTDRMADWLDNGEVGQSAKAIGKYMIMGHAPKAYPHDYDDLRRCLLFLDRFPEFERRFQEMQHFTGWEKIAAGWAEIKSAILEADPEAIRPISAVDVLTGICL